MSNWFKKLFGGKECCCHKSDDCCQEGGNCCQENEEGGKEVVNEVKAETVSTNESLKVEEKVELADANYPVEIASQKSEELEEKSVNSTINNEEVVDVDKAE